MFESVIAEYSKQLETLLSKKSQNFSEASLVDVPPELGVYLIFNKSNDTIIYAGRSKNLQRRLLRNHKRGNRSGSQFRKAFGRAFNISNEKEISDKICQNCSFKFLILENFEESIRLEHFVTAILGPTLNTKLKN